MKNSAFLITWIIFVLVNQLSAQISSVQQIEDGKFIKKWLLIGPVHLPKQEQASGHQWEHAPGFETDYLLSAGGEKNPVLKPGKTINFEGDSARCVIYNSVDSLINLDLVLSKDAPVLAYGYTEVEVPNEQVKILSLGSNDGCRLWLNGEIIWDVPTERGLFADDDQIPVLLKKGKNTLLLKVEERGGSWGFCMRFLPFSTDNQQITGKFFSVSTQTDGKIKLLSAYPENILNRIVQSVEINIVSDMEKPVLQETRTSDFTGPFQFETTDFKGYFMKLHTILKSGEIIDHEILFNAGVKKTFTLFANGKSGYQIVTVPGASESEKWAAQELQRWIEEVSGVKIPLVNSVAQPDTPAIFVGYGDQVKNLTSSSQPGSNDESFIYTNVGEHIVIFGGSQRGTMYGVMSFLENELGCRWYTPGVAVAPEKNEFNFERLHHTEKPGLRVRNDFYFEAFDPIWAARNRMNGTLGFSDTATPQPGGTENYWAVHTFYPLVPPEEFFDKHPEYYSLIDGKRIFERAQLCLSNPDVLKIVTERIKKQMEKSPEYLIYDVSQNDWYNPCQCDNCQKLTKEYGGESGIVIWFVNQVAEAAEKDFPGKFIGTLAYQYTRTPPKNISPRKNVVVRLCSIECCFSHDFKTCPQNQSFVADLKGWSTISPHLYIWDYVVNFSHYIMPYPNFNVLQPNIKTFQENNSIGIMEQAAYQSRGGEFAELRAYLISKLLWNPDCNTEEVINDFMFGYYGRSGQFVREYFNYLQSRVTPQTHIHLGLSPDDVLFSGNFVAEAEAIFRKAENIADNPEILRRVEMAELPLLYLKCRQTPELAVYDGTYAKFSRIVEREGITHYAEVGKSHKEEFHRNMERFK